MSGPTDRGAGDAGTSKSGKPAKSSGSKPVPLAGGISEDANSYEDLLEQPENSMSLEAQWLYKLHDQVFGPIKAKDLLEKLYHGEVDAETPIAPEDGEFMQLRRYGAFRSHLSKAKDHLEAVAEVAKKDKEAKQKRIKRTVLFATVALSLATGAYFGIHYAIRSSLERDAQERSRIEEDKLRDELEALNATVTSEPPLIDFPADEAEKGAPKGSPRKRRAATGGAVAYNGPPGAELTGGEIIGGIQSVFDGIKRCLVEQMHRDRDSVPERLVLSFNINNQGSVQNVDLDDRTLRGGPLKLCMASKLAELHFRKFNGEVRNVEYPLNIGHR
jgi:hypothetical protein